MKAIAWTRYGPPDVLQLRDVPTLTAAQDGMACHAANAFVDVTYAGGQSLAQAADDVVASANPDIEVQRTDIVVGGEPAVLLDDLYAADVFRKVVVSHGDRLYTLSFVPWVADIPDFPRIETLYETVLSSFEFVE